MAGILQHLRSSTLDKRPNPASMVDGQVAINYASGAPGMFFKDSNGSLVKVGPVHVGSGAPNAVPASGGTAGNSIGEQWLDTSGGTYVFKIWDGSAWRSEAGEFVNTTGDTMTGNLVLDNANLVFEGSTANDFETTLTVVDPTADRTITLPDVTGTVVTTGDTGTVTSTMIANSTIVDADISASAEIAVSKLADGTARQLLQTDAAGTGVEWTSNVDVPGTLDVTGAAVFDSTVSVTGAATVTSNLTVDTNTFFVDATNNRVGVLTTTPATALDVNGDVTIADRIIHTGDTNTQIRFPAADTVSIETSGSERARIDSSGRLLVGTSTSLNAGGLNGNLQAASNSLTSRNVLFSYFANDVNGPIVNIGKSRSGTVGTYTYPTSGDILGAISFDGANTADNRFNTGASIIAYANQTWSATAQGSYVVFSTTADGASSPTERFRINSGGTLYSANNSVHLGTEGAVMAGGGRFTVHGDFFNSTAGAAFSTTNDSNNAIYVQFGNSSGTKIGSITRASSTSVAYNTTSDYRLKENVLPIQAATQLIRQLKPVSYNFVGHTDEQSTGFIAHELQGVIPEAVTGEKDATYADGSPNYQGVDLSKLVPLLTAALQEAIGRIETLEAEVSALKGA